MRDYARHCMANATRLHQCSIRRTDSGAGSAYDCQALGGLGGGSPTSDERIASRLLKNTSPTGSCRENASVDGSDILPKLVTQSTASGQSLAQSGTAGLSSGQHGMPSGIDAIACAVIAGVADEAAAMGPVTSPKRASARSRRLANDQGFIGLNMS